MNVQLAQANLVALLLVSLRIIGWAMIAPPLATSGIPKSMKTMISVSLALALTPSQVAHVPALEPVPIIIVGVVQVTIGVALGFLTRLIFAALDTAGSLIDLGGGFAISSAYDPLMLTNTSLFQRFHGLLASVLIFVTTAHQYILQGFFRTFTSVPLDGHFSMAKVGKSLTHGIGDWFVATLQIAGPLLIVMFIADLTLGLMSRIAPAMNVFSLSFPFKILLTLLLLGFTFLLMPQVIANFTEDTLRVFKEVT